MYLSFLQAAKVDSSGTETSFPNFATVRITLTDVNDNVPTFTADVYHVSISESDPDDAYVFAEVVALDRDQVRLRLNTLHYKHSKE